MLKNTLFNNTNPQKSAVTLNNAGGKAYTSSSEVSLARLVCTSFFGDTFYTDGKKQLNELKNLANKCSPEFVAACAVYARQKARMKDTSVALLATLRTRNVELYKSIFNLVADDMRQIRGLVQMIRSGQFGSKSLGTATRKKINRWLASKSPISVWNMSIGDAPSLRDVMRLSRPSPSGDSQREAVYKLIVTGEKTEDLPQLIKEFFAFRENMTAEMPRVPFERLTDLPLTDDHWVTLGTNMTWNQIRQNINSLERHNVLANKEAMSKLVAKITNPDEVSRAKVFPYQVYTSVLNIKNQALKNAMQTALDHSVNNIPVFPENTIIAVDVSGSMTAAVNGVNVNGGLTCSQVASLMAASIYKKNPTTRILTFAYDTKEYTNQLNPHDSLMTNISRIHFSGGGTACSSALKYVTDNNLPCDLFIMFSDNESWADFRSGSGVTAMKLAWQKIKQQNKDAKLVLSDLAPRQTSQMPEAKDTLFVAGFTNNIFPTIANWYDGKFTDFNSEIMNHYHEALKVDN